MWGIGVYQYVAYSLIPIFLINPIPLLLNTPQMVLLLGGWNYSLMFFDTNRPNVSWFFAESLKKVYNIVISNVIIGGHLVPLICLRQNLPQMLPQRGHPFISRPLIRDKNHVFSISVDHVIWNMIFFHDYIWSYSIFHDHMYYIWFSSMWSEIWHILWVHMVIVH